MAEEAPTTSDLALLRLKRAGWSVGDTAFAGTKGITWLVSGINGENLIRAWGPTQSSAWEEAIRQAMELGMFERGPGRSSLDKQYGTELKSAPFGVGSAVNPGVQPDLDRRFHLWSV